MLFGTVVCGLVVVCSGCGSAPGPADGVPDARRGGVLRLAHESPQALDPAAVDSVYESLPVNQIFDGLVALDASLSVRPGLASTWTLSRDGRTYTLHLRPGVSFHDGSLLEAEDVVFTIRRLLAPGRELRSVAASYLSGVVGASEFAAGRSKELPGVRAVSPLTVQIELERPYLSLSGRSVFRFAVTKFQELVRRILDRNCFTLDELDLVVPHQANRRIIETATKKLGLPEEKVFVNIEKYGNTSSASIPLALDEAVRSGRLTRGMLVLLCEAYTPDESRPSGVYMKFHPRLAPIQAAVFPLVAKDGMPEVAEKLHRELRGKYAVQFDVKQSVGKRYARMDEAGTPYCFTIDGDTLHDQTVTVRDRDTAAQERTARIWDAASGRLHAATALLHVAREGREPGRTLEQRPGLLL